jgi:hypothetical protein
MFHCVIWASYAALPASVFGWIGGASRMMSSMHCVGGLFGLYVGLLGAW